MSTRVETDSGAGDALKWLVITCLMVAGIVGFYYFAEQSLLLRVIVLLAIIGGALALSVQTVKGRIAWDYVREARTEIRKVVWPSRKETLQMTGVVIVMVTIVAIFLWILDGALAWLVRILLPT